MNPFDFFIAYVAWEGGGKNRPVLVFVLGEETVDVYRITTKYENKTEAVRAHCFRIDDWAQAGLDAQSYVDTSTLITLSKAVFENRAPIGKLTENDKLRLLEFLAG